MYITLLNEIKNAQMAGKPSLKVYYSEAKLAVLDLLTKQKFVSHTEVKGRKLTKRSIEIFLNTAEAGRRIRGVKFLSKPSRRLYGGYKDIRPIRGGAGVLVLSTPKGIVTGQEARKLKVGGELLFEIW